MYDLLIWLADLAGGNYTILADGSIMAWNWLGELAGCGTFAEAGQRANCVEASL